jgi:hypothetical protein
MKMLCKAKTFCKVRAKMVEKENHCDSLVLLSMFYHKSDAFIGRDSLDL